MSHFKTGQKLASNQINEIAHQGIQLIEEQVLETEQTSVTFSGIDQNFQNLWLFMSAGINSTVPRFLVARLNGDTGTNYTSHALQHRGDGTSGTDFINPAGFVAVGIVNTNLLAQNSIYFPGYARTDRDKSVLSTFAAPASSAAADSLLGLAGGKWSSTSAITDIELLEQPAGGVDPILAGSIFTLYGLGETTS